MITHETKFNSVTCTMLRPKSIAIDPLVERVTFCYISWRTNGKCTGNCLKSLWDGKTLNILTEEVMGVLLQNWERNPRDREIRNNIRIILDHIKAMGIPTLNLSSSDILNKGGERNERILKMLEHMFLYDLKKKLARFGYVEKNDDGYTMFLSWINYKLNPIISLHVTNFEDCWASGKILGALVESMVPGTLPDWEGMNEARDHRRINTVSSMKAAKTIGINSWLEPDEMCTDRANKVSNAMYLSQFLDCVQENANVFRDGDRRIPRAFSEHNMSRGQEEYIYQSDSIAQMPITTPREGYGTGNLMGDSDCAPDSPPQTAIVRPLPVVRPSNRSPADNYSYCDPRLDQPRSPRAKKNPIVHDDPIITPILPGQTVEEYVNQLPAEYKAKLADAIQLDALGSVKEIGQSSADGYDYCDPPQAKRKPNSDVDPRITAFLPGQTEAEFWDQIPAESRDKWKTKLADVIQRGELRFAKMIGQGDFSTVHHVRFTHPRDGYKMLAAKTLAGDGLVIQDVLNMLSEVDMMRNFAHENVLSLVCMTFDKGTPYILSPLMKNGDLQKYLTEHTGALKCSRLLGFGIDVANGMQYLHDEAGFIRQNLSTNHCLLDENFKVKIYDFQSARETLASEYIMTDKKFTATAWQRMAPETLGGVGPKTANTKSDLWLYGILLCEIYFYGKTPFWKMDSIPKLLLCLKNGNKVPQPQNMPDDLYQKFVLKCTALNPDDRPSFNQLVSWYRIGHGLSKELTKMQSQRPDIIEEHQMYEVVYDQLNEMDIYDDTEYPPRSQMIK